jgi:hypothetical protein
MARPLSCPVCRIDLPDGDTHCPRCGLRIAPLPRRARRQSTAVDASGGVVAADTPISIPQALVFGLLGGVALVALAALIALAVSRGSAFATALSNAAFFTGGVTMTLAVVLGGVRVRRIVGDVETMRRRALSGGERLVHDHVRLAVGTAAAMPLAVAVALAVAAH